MKNQRIPVDGGADLTHNPFTTLTGEGLPPGPHQLPVHEAMAVKKHRGRVDILRVKAGRGGKTVTMVKNFMGIAGQNFSVPSKQIG